MTVKSVACRIAAAAGLSLSLVVALPQAASASPSLSITATVDPSTADTLGVVSSGNADSTTYLYVYAQSSTTPCAANAQDEFARVGGNRGVADEGPVNGSFSRSANYVAGPGSYVMCGYLDAPEDAPGPTPLATAVSNTVVEGACPAAPSLRLTHISVVTDAQPGEGYTAEATVAAQVNEAGTITPTQVHGDGGSGDQFTQGGTSSLTVEDYPHGAHAEPGGVVTYQVEFAPDEPSSCYDSSTGTVVHPTGVSVTKTLTVTYFYKGQGGTASADGQTVPGSNTETAVPGAPSPTITGTSRVGTTDTCSATNRSHGSGKYAWYVGGNQVATGSTYKIAAASYQKPLHCSTRMSNNAAKFGPMGVSSAVTVGRGAPLRSTNPPAFNGQNRAGQRMSVTHGEWSPKATSWTYQWLIGSKKIRGATDNRYKIALKYKGKRITCRVTAHASGYAPGTATPKSLKVH